MHILRIKAVNGITLTEVTKSSSLDFEDLEIVAKVIKNIRLMLTDNWDTILLEDFAYFTYTTLTRKDVEIFSKYLPTKGMQLKTILQIDILFNKRSIPLLCKKNP